MSITEQQNSIGLAKAKRGTLVANKLSNEAHSCKCRRRIWRGLVGMVGVSGVVFKLFPDIADALGPQFPSLMNSAAPFLLLGAAVIYDIPEPKNPDRMEDYAFIIRHNVYRIDAALRDPNHPFAEDRLQIAIDATDIMVLRAITEWWNILRHLEEVRHEVEGPD